MGAGSPGSAMGQGKIFRYGKIIRDFDEDPFRERILYSERITAVYGGGPTSTGEWTPAVDVYETEDSLIVVAEVAGLRQEDIRLEVAGNVLTLRGHRPFARSGVSSENYYRMEFPYGVFERSFALPRAVVEDGVEAVLKDGVLTIRLPLADVVQGREIEVGG